MLTGQIPLWSASSKSLQNTGRQELFLESVDLLVRFVLAKEPLTLAEVAKETVARSLLAVYSSLKRLVQNGEARRVNDNGRAAFSLTSQGIHSLSSLEGAWNRLQEINRRISPLKSYQRDSFSIH